MNRLIGAMSGRVVSRAIGAVLQALTLIVVARLTGPSDFGVFILWNSATLILGGILSFGASTRVLRQSAEENPEITSWALFKVRWFSVGISLVLILGALFSVGMPALGAIGVAFALADLVADFESAWLAGALRPVASSWTVVAQKALPAISAVACLQIGGIWFLWCAPAVMTLWCLTRALPRRAPGIRLRGLVGSSRGYWALTIVANLNLLEPLILRTGFGVQTVGLYSAASRIGNPLTIFVSAMQTVFVPHFSKRDGTAKGTLRPILFVASAYAVLVVVASPLIVLVAVVLFGSEYNGSKPLIYAFVFAAAISAISQALQVDLLIRGHAGLAATAIATGATLGLVWLFILGRIDWPDALPSVPIFSQVAILVMMCFALLWSNSVGSSTPSEGTAE